MAQPARPLPERIEPAAASASAVTPRVADGRPDPMEMGRQPAPTYEHDRMSDLLGAIGIVTILIALGGILVAIVEVVWPH